MSTAGADARFVIAADAGGTHSRVGCFGMDGTMIGSATGRGGSPYHQADAAANVAEVTERALRTSGLQAGGAVGLVAGLAMVSRPGSNQGDGDNSWARDFFRVPGLVCERRILNDAVVAHRGALVGEPGVIVVAGTGSMILAIDAEGREVESGQFEHYAGAARHLAYEAVQLILTGAAVPADRDLVAAVLEHWGAPDVPMLRRTLLALGDAERMSVRHRYGDLAPVVTVAAATSPLADRAVRELAGKTARGVELLAPLVRSEPVPVVTVGGLATTSAFGDRLDDALASGPSRAQRVPSALDPLRGAAMMALADIGVVVDDPLIRRLRERQDAEARSS